MRVYFKNNPLFAANGASVTGETNLVRAGTGRPLRYEMLLKVRGYIDGTSQSDLTTRENNLRTLLINSYGDLELRQDSGAKSGLALANATSISGVVITSGPTFAEAEGAEYVTRRTVDFTGVAQFVIRGSEPAIVEWEEVFAFTGTCGPVTGWRPNLIGPWVQQQIYPSSTMKVTHTGRAVGHLVRPNPPPPKWAFPIEKQHLRRIVQEAGRRIGPAISAVIEPAVSWVYEYENNTPLVALPGPPPF